LKVSWRKHPNYTNYKSVLIYSEKWPTSLGCGFVGDAKASPPQTEYMGPSLRSGWQGELRRDLM